MSRVVILGAGIAGHTTATLLKRSVGEAHEVVVVSPASEWNWIPSNIWVGVGVMAKEDVLFPIGPVYRRMGIVFKQARALSLFPSGKDSDPRPCVEIESTEPSSAGQRETLAYDYLVNATGPRLHFEKTEGLGPGKNSHSVCTADHAEDAAAAFRECMDRMKRGERQTLVVGTGHGTCTCEGAAFEYVFNVEHELRRHGVRDRARVVYLTNEFELGDFGMGGMRFKRGGYGVPSRIFAESLYAERGIEWIKRAHVKAVSPGAIHYETLEGDEGEIAADFKMLLPPFSGVELKAFDRAGNDISPRLFAPSGFMKVDADYTQKGFEDFRPSDWPSTYQSPEFANLFAPGIAFAPPHPISKPCSNPRGTPIFAAPPRTGMTAGIMGRTVAASLAARLRDGPDAPLHKSPFATMGAACIASAGTGWLRGTAASITLYPLVPDYEKYPNGRDLDNTSGEIGLAGHWIKHILHHMFIYKAKCNPLWHLIPE